MNKSRRKATVKKSSFIAFMFLVGFLASLAVMFVATDSFAEEEEIIGWVICQPDSFVYLRSFPSFTSDIAAMLNAGDQVYPDGQRHGVWVHVMFQCEAGGGWIHRGYITDSEPEIFPDGIRAETIRGKVMARRYAGGPIRKKLKKGTELVVYLISDEWSITNRGFVKTEFLIMYYEEEQEEQAA